MRYPIPAGQARVEEVILRSRFITTAAPVTSQEEARAFIASIREEFAGATHNCYAYLVGPPGSTAQVGMSDDGEPAGTAGRPMLAVLLGSGIGDLAVVVTRYYGGTKLGTGGLVRAYAGGVKAVLSELKLVDRVAYAIVSVRGAYHWVTPLNRLLPQYEAEAIGQEFGADVVWQIRVPQEHAQALTGALKEMSHGAIKVLE